MQPTINDTQYGSITKDGTIYNHDVIVQPDGSIRERSKPLSRKYYGTSHRVSREEAQCLKGNKAEQLIVGTGQAGNLAFKAESEEYLGERGYEVIEQQPTPKAIRRWNEAEGQVEGLFQVTC